MNKRAKALIVIGLMALFIIGLFSVGSFAETKEDTGDYCAREKNGKIAVMHNGKEITTETTVANGIHIRPDGTVVMRDGSQLSLEDNQCMDKDGGLLAPKINDSNKTR